MKNSKVLLLVFIFIFLTIPFVFAQEGLVAHYTFDNDQNNLILDTSGNGISGIPYNISYENSFSGQAAVFDGKTSFIDLGQSSLLKPNNEITVSVWIKPKSMNQGQGNIFQNGNNWDNGHGIIFQQKNDSLIMIVFTENGNIRDQAIALNVFSADEWVYVSGTYDGTKAKIYVNGELKASTPSHAFKKITNDNINSTIGKISSLDWAYFNGSMDELEISNKALTRDEILDRYCQFKDCISQGRPVEIAIDYNKVIMTSNLSIGITHVSRSLDSWGNPDSIERGKNLLKELNPVQNQFVNGFGADIIWPDPRITNPDDWNWARLDERVQLMKDIGGTPVLTFFMAPDWMKVKDFDPETYPYEDLTDWTKTLWAVLPEHEEDFAFMSKEVAKRYPEINHFMVWAELQGFWNNQTKNWDYERYTRMYNKVWDAVKSVRPDAKIGGPYLIIQGDGSENLQRVPKKWYSETPIIEKNKEILDYWLKNKHGADFIAIDRHILSLTKETYNYSKDQMMELSHWFGNVTEQIKNLEGYNGEPIWYSEVYTGRTYDDDFTKASIASILYHQLIAGTSVSLRWAPMRNPITVNKQNLITNTEVQNGGETLPLYYTYLYFSKYFGPGTEIIKSTSSSKWVEVLASKNKILLINKKAENVITLINGKEFELKRYGVVLLNTDDYAIENINNYDNGNKDKSSGKRTNNSADKIANDSFNGTGKEYKITNDSINDGEKEYNQSESVETTKSIGWVFDKLLKFFEGIINDLRSWFK